jgi:hypothetical protein
MTDGELAALEARMISIPATLGVRIFSHGSMLPNPEYETVSTPKHPYTLTPAGLARRLFLQETAKAESNQDAG